MKKIFLSVALASLSLAAMAQAKKPTIMVVPSDVYCISNGYSQQFVANGVEQTLPDYKKMLQNDRNMRLAITKLAAIMADRGFPLKDLEQELKNLEQEAAEAAALQGKEGGEIAESPIDKLKRTAKADIIMDLDFNVQKKGPQSYVNFNLRGLDAYTAKQVAGAAGSGKPSTAAAPELLLEEAVISYIDEFNGRLQSFFEDMFANGREIKLQLKRFGSAPFDFEEEFDYDGDAKEFGDIVDAWLEKNCVQGRFSRVDGTGNMLKYEQVRIPLFKESSSGRQTAIDARTFANDLRSVLRKPPFSVDCKVYQRGLGEAWIVVGEK
ncbi:MAG: DUF6175 family protein [Prevotellaceae bacterium]|jgi:hypothetical protein|nr:DUF6175 family protein [Prevotellaceae bacterium]